jgi:hypothetical protein
VVNGSSREFRWQGISQSRELRVSWAGPHRVGVAEIETLFYQLGGQAAATALMGDGVDHGIGWLPQAFAVPCRLNGCASVATIGRSRDRTLSIGVGLTGWTRHIITQWRAIRAATERQLLLHACPVRRDQRRRILDRRVRSRETGDAYLAGHWCFPRAVGHPWLFPRIREPRAFLFLCLALMAAFHRYLWNKVTLSGLAWQASA